MKPIEPGCRAIIINRAPEDNGKEVTVITFIGEIPPQKKSNKISFYRTKNNWKIDKKVKSLVRNNNHSPYRPCSNEFQNFVPEQHLLRIDGYEETQEQKQSAKV